MKKFSTILILFSTVTFLAFCSGGKSSKGTEPANLTSEEKKAIGSIRTFLDHVKNSENNEKQTKKALARIDTEYVSNFLINNELSKLNDTDKKDYTNAIEEHIKLRAFPTAHKYFSKIDLVYYKPVYKENTIVVPSILLYKGKDKVTFSWIVKKSDLKIIDLLNEKGASSMSESRDKQILPYYKKQGIRGLIDRLDKINAKLAKKIK